MKPITLALMALLAVGAGDIRAALAGTSAMVSGAEARPEGNPGSDRDAQGCIGSAGYVWCAREQQCVRSWELAKAKGFAVTEVAFQAYCSGTQ